MAGGPQSPTPPVTTPEHRPPPPLPHCGGPRAREQGAPHEGRGPSVKGGGGCRTKAWHSGLWPWEWGGGDWAPGAGVVVGRRGASQAFHRPPGPLWDTDDVCRTGTVQHKAEVQSKRRMKKLFSDMSWAPFAKKNRHSEPPPPPTPKPLTECPSGCGGLPPTLPNAPQRPCCGALWDTAPGAQGPGPIRTSAAAALGASVRPPHPGALGRRGASPADMRRHHPLGAWLRAWGQWGAHPLPPPTHLRSNRSELDAVIPYPPPPTRGAVGVQNCRGPGGPRDAQPQCSWGGGPADGGRRAQAKGSAVKPPPPRQEFSSKRGAGGGGRGSWSPKVQKFVYQKQPSSTFPFVKFSCFPTTKSGSEGRGGCWTPPQAPRRRC